MDGAIDHEMPVREQSVTLTEELEREVKATPAFQPSWVEVAVLRSRYSGSEAANTLG